MSFVLGYDSGEKKRTPAWCDRILYRDSRVSGSASECSLDCPVVGSITQYEACMDVTDSDHKPVRCIFNVDVALVDHTIRRQEFQHIIESNARIQSMLEDLLKVPETIVSTNNIIFQNNDTSVLRISNKSRSEKGLFTIICEGEATVNEEGMAMDHRPRGSFGLPRWLGVNPASGIIEPDHTVEISIHHRDFHTLEEYVDGLPRNSWCEDTRDKEVMLAVKIQGSCTTETTSHRIRVRHCFPAKNKHSEPITDDSRKVTGKLLQRSNIQHLNTSIDMFDQLRKLHTP